MKKSYFFVLIFFVFSSVISAQTEQSQNLSFYIELNSSYNHESRNDYVIATSGRINSLLEWNATYLFKEGITAGVKPGRWEFYVSTQFALPLECGKMYDSDWYVRDIKTNYSKSNLFTAFGLDAALGAKYHFLLGQNDWRFYISPQLAVTNSYIIFNAKNTIGWCGDIGHTHTGNYAWDSEYAVIKRKYGIDLRNNITSVLLGLELSKYFGPAFVNAGALAAPFTYIFSVDHHLNKEGGRWYQMIQKAYFTQWNFYGTLGYSINNHHAIILKADYSFCPAVGGELYDGYYKVENIVTEEKSGFEFQKVGVSVSWRYTF